VTQLQILNETQTLVHSHVTIGLEHHHCQWTAWGHVTDNELSNYVQTNGDVGHGLNHADGDHPEQGNYEADNQWPPKEAGIPNKNCNERQNNLVADQ
jgi:hypothetical protein